MSKTTPTGSELVLRAARAYESTREFGMPEL